MRNRLSMMVMVFSTALGACEATDSAEVDAGAGGGTPGGSGGNVGGDVTGGHGGGIVGGSGGIEGGAGGSGGIAGGAGGSGGIAGGSGGSGGIAGGSGGSGGIAGGSGGSGGIAGGSGGSGGVSGGEGGSGGGGGAGGAMVECTPDDCGPEPDAAACPDGSGPRIACETQADGSCGWSVGPCPRSDCGGLLGAVCADGEYCDFPDDGFCGAADAAGTCQLRPEVCEPVDGLNCGCDGQEYESDCAAAAAGTDVAFAGPCGGIGCGPDDCGPPPPVLPCPDGSGPPMSCEPSRDGQCGWSIGECPAPEPCGEGACGGPPPVAACDDGSPMPISCEREDDGQCNWHVLECPPAGVSCGGRAGNTCADNQFCDFARDGCDFADAQGTCQDRPEICNLLFAPVCGCNGQTYDNLCAAQAAGVDAALAGECPR